MSEGAVNDLFVGLLMQLHYAAWLQLGKVTNPVTGKTERDLETAKETIDLLGALEEKTRGNLHPEEAKLLARLLLELRMNYVEELKSSPPASAPGSGVGQESTGSAAESTGSAQDGPAKET